MQYHFDSEVAKEVGVQGAVLFDNIYFWIRHNTANEKHFYDGRYWTYNSTKAFAELFDFMTERQINYALKKLIECNYIITGNYNKSAYDRTLWYAITDKGMSVYNPSGNVEKCFNEKGEVDLTNSQNGIASPVKSITDSKQQPVKQDKKELLSNDNKKNFNFGSGKNTTKKSMYQNCIDMIHDFITSTKSPDTTEQLLMDYLNLRLQMQDKPLRYANQWKGILNTLQKLPPDTWEESITNSIVRGWANFYAVKNNPQANKTTFDSEYNPETEADRQAQEEFIRQRKARGERTEW